MPKVFLGSSAERLSRALQNPDKLKEVSKAELSAELNKLTKQLDKAVQTYRKNPLSNFGDVYGSKAGKYFKGTDGLTKKSYKNKAEMLKAIKDLQQLANFYTPEKIKKQHKAEKQKLKSGKVTDKDLLRIWKIRDRIDVKHELYGSEQIMQVIEELIIRGLSDDEIVKKIKEEERKHNTYEQVQKELMQQYRNNRTQNITTTEELKARYTRKKNEFLNYKGKAKK